jgi:hypothetical protein
LLNPAQTFYLPPPDVLLDPETEHFLAYLLVEDETIPAMSLIEDTPTVSENVFTPLGRSATDGKQFKKETPLGQQPLFAEFGHRGRSS